MIPLNELVPSAVILRPLDLAALAMAFLTLGAMVMGRLRTLDRRIQRQQKNLRWLLRIAGNYRFYRNPFEPSPAPPAKSFDRVEPDRNGDPLILKRFPQAT